MARYKRADESVLSEKQKEAIRYHEEVQGGHMTNMKYTLLRDLKAFEVYMGWYDLSKEVKQFMSDREFNVLCYGVSSGNDCLVCGTFFRKILIESGEDPDALKLSKKEETIFNFAKAMAKDFHNIPGEIYDELDTYYNEEQMIQLIAFAGQMYATNVFVTTAKVDLDEILINYRKG